MLIRSHVAAHRSATGYDRCIERIKEGHIDTTFPPPEFAIDELVWLAVPDDNLAYSNYARGRV